MGTTNRMDDDTRFLAFLSRLILTWEQGRFELIARLPREFIRALLEENGLH